MFPVLLKIPIFGAHITIYTYGFFVAVAFLLGMIWVGREARRVGQDSARAMDLAFYIIIGAIVGSRIFYVLVSEWNNFLQNPVIIFKIWDGGLVFYGGLIASIAVAIWYMRRHNLSFWIFSDIFAPAIALGHVFGRIGCFMAGCCHGRLVDHPAWYSVIFPGDPHSFAPQGIPLYPTQLMEAGGEFLIFGILLVVRKYKKFDGQLLATYLISYSLLRSFVEYFRGDSARGFLVEPWLSTSTVVSILLFAAGFIIYFKKWKRQ